MESIRTPFEGVAPLYLEAQVAENLLRGESVRTSTRPWSWLAALLAATGLAQAGWQWPRRRWPLAAGAALVLAWPVASWGAFAASSWHLPVVPPLLAGALAGWSALKLHLSQRERRAEEMRRTWEGSLPAGTVEAMVQGTANLDAGRERHAATVLHAEVQGGAAWAERQEVAALVPRVAGLNAALRRAILAEGGAIEIRGFDGLRASFGAPVASATEALHACRAAVNLRAELAKETLRVLVGITSGPLAVGVLAPGSLVILGAAAQAAGRLARLNRAYGTSILLSEGVAPQVRETFLLRELDRVRWGNDAVATTIFELVAGGGEEQRNRQRVVRYEAGLTAYRNREFLRAERLFTSILEDLGADPPSQVLAERCRRFRAAPPAEGWDGTTEVTA